jgi:hypothetical protein
METELSISQYLESLSKKEQKAYNIAKDHLGSSFSLEKSIGFIGFVKDAQEKKGDVSSKKTDK